MDRASRIHAALGESAGCSPCPVIIGHVFRYLATPHSYARRTTHRSCTRELLQYLEFLAMAIFQCNCAIWRSELMCPRSKDLRGLPTLGNKAPRI